MNKLYCKIYEIKAIIECLSDVSACNEEIHHPIIDRLTVKMNEIIEEMEEDA